MIVAGSLGFQYIRNRVVATADLILKAESLFDSGWWDVYGIHPLSFEVSGFGQAELVLYASNRLEQSIDVGVRVGPVITQDTMIYFEAPCRWVRAAIINYTSGTITCTVMGSDVR